MRTPFAVPPLGARELSSGPSHGLPGAPGLRLEFGQASRALGSRVRSPRQEGRTPRKTEGRSLENLRRPNPKRRCQISSRLRRHGGRPDAARAGLPRGAAEGRQPAGQPALQPAPAVSGRRGLPRGLEAAVEIKRNVPSVFSPHLVYIHVLLSGHSPQGPGLVKV